jgi:acetoacetate decarboxylase
VVDRRDDEPQNHIRGRPGVQFAARATARRGARYGRLRHRLRPADHGPLYPDPPYYYRGAKVLLGVYEADTERVARHLPPGVTALEDPVRCIAWVCTYPFTTFGTYNEAILLVRVAFDGESYNCCPFIYVDAEAPMAAGREIWGWPKKFAELRFDFGGPGPGYREQFLFTVERPAGKRILTLNMSPDRPSSLEEVGGLPMLTLRYIPNSEAGKPPSICELVRTDVEMTVHQAPDGSVDLWAGRASVTMDSPSAMDPLHDLAATAMLGGFYGTFDWTLPQGRVIKDYVADTEAGEGEAAGAERDLALSGTPAGAAG